MFDLESVQEKIREFQLDGWLLYDFRGRNFLAHRVLDFQPDQTPTRRFLYFIPASGEPRKLVHRVEPGVLDHLPGDKVIYLPWKQFEEEVAALVTGAAKVAMEYSPRNANPYVAIVDAGTVELVKSFGIEVVSSGDLVQTFEATLSDEQIASHFEAETHTVAAFDRAWSFIADRLRQQRSVREHDVQQEIMAHFAERNMTTYHPPIVGVNANASNPHYEPSPTDSTEIKPGDLVLIDLWAKMDRPGAVYSDLTKMCFIGANPPAEFEDVFQIVAAARDAAIEVVRQSFAASRPLHGWQVDDAARDVIDKAGYGEYFRHRTGHSIGQETHGNGANMDNIETREERLVAPRTCFSIEPGIYLEKFGIRSEVNVMVDAAGEVKVTGGQQNHIQSIVTD